MLVMVRTTAQTPGDGASRGGKDTSEEKDRTLPRRSAREKKGKTGGAGENKNLHKN